jgi:hypothetical protein
LDAFRAHELAREGAADPHDVLGKRLLVEHRVEGHDALDHRRREVELLRGVVEHRRVDEAELLLAELEKRQAGRSFVRVTGDDAVEQRLALRG